MALSKEKVGNQASPSGGHTKGGVSFDDGLKNLVNHLYRHRTIYIINISVYNGIVPVFW